MKAQPQYVNFANGCLRMTLEEIKKYEITKDSFGHRWISYEGGKFEINDTRV